MTNSPATRPPNPYGLRRFVEAQDPVYNQVRTELTPDGHPNSPTCGHLKLPHPERGVTMG